MRRGLTKTIDNYIKVRISQLEEDREKASYDQDKQWYTKLIQELRWVVNPSENCGIEILNDLHKVASKNSGKGRIFKRCLEKELSFEDVEALAIINNQTSFTATGVETILDIIER